MTTEIEHEDDFKDILGVQSVIVEINMASVEVSNEIDFDDPEPEVIKTEVSEESD